jgi:hypothetical protein
MMADRLLTRPFLIHQALLSMKQTFVNRHGDGVWSSFIVVHCDERDIPVLLSSSVSFILVFYSDLFRVNSLVGDHLLSC